MSFDTEPQKNLRVLIIGTGSIGQRHLRNIRALSPDAKFTFFRNPARQDRLVEEYQADLITDSADIKAGIFHLVVIANPSSMHFEFLQRVIIADIPFYIEKPVVTELTHVQQLMELIRTSDSQVRSVVGCNLRLLPCMSRTRELLNSGAIGKVVRANMQVGQWLPSWRPGTNYSQCYSAKRDLGGGVIFDLIHEIDLARYFFGEFKQCYCLGGHQSDLNIETEDVAGILMASEKGAVVTIGLDYIARKKIRKYEIFGTEGTLELDLIDKQLLLKTESDIQVITNSPGDFNTDQTYVDGIDYLLDGLDRQYYEPQELRDGLRSTELALRLKEQITL